MSRKRDSKPRHLHNSYGAIINHFFSWGKEQFYQFKEFGVDGDLGDETYLAVFLSCWLCKFVLPSRKFNHIRLSVFKVESMMAWGGKFSLVVPVLACIHNGLRELTSSSQIKKCEAIFPIHYVYSWIGYYFDAYFSSNHIHCGARMAKSCTRLSSGSQVIISSHLATKACLTTKAYTAWLSKRLEDASIPTKIIIKTSKNVASNVPKSNTSKGASTKPSGTEKILNSIRHPNKVKKNTTKSASDKVKKIRASKEKEIVLSLPSVNRPKDATENAHVKVPQLSSVIMKD
ncbi:hypothetical protein RJ639_008086 [Escallonia herrerae]|uniref:Aminotransferase-like plant mobile domain-containing protein n=1 Tax=Escallonia herrerae TaxID=1293975 RepID=A0AA89ASS4_9ASTE|nr:hypothetical protein RJ639_008086 [Escallonia herrerae]